jgi:hypothetical protein
VFREAVHAETIAVTRATIALSDCAEKGAECRFHQTSAAIFAAAARWEKTRVHRGLEALADVSAGSNPSLDGGVLIVKA